MLIFTEEQQCCGCGACEQVCPKHCITMKENREGFLYPEIDDAKCIECGKCKSICPTISGAVQNKALGPTAYAAYSKNEMIRENSSSGGVFSEIAKAILSQGGVVVGAAFDKDWSVHHVAVETLEELERLRGSKYLQSRTEETYHKVREELKKGRVVLYTGTPCEIEGVKAFLGCEYENLYTQDLICHGVPSPKLWKKYLAWQERRAGAPARQTFFRHKKYGWKTFALSLLFNNDKAYVQILSKDLYMQIFLQNICLRPSCYACRFKTQSRVSDITLADFWGCDEVCPELNDNKGLSLVLVHSPKGEKLLQAIKSEIVLKEVDTGLALKGNVAMTHSCKKPRLRDAFMSDLDRLTIPELAGKYLQKKGPTAYLKQLVPVAVKKQVKKFMNDNAKR